MKKENYYKSCVCFCHSHQRLIFRRKGWLGIVDTWKNLEGDLDCFLFDNKEAEKWNLDLRLLNKGKFKGYGHQVGNSALSCKNWHSPNNWLVPSTCLD